MMSGTGVIADAIEFEFRTHERESSINDDFPEPEPAPYVRPMTALEASCHLCFGKGVLSYPNCDDTICNCRKVADVATIRRMLMLLTVDQMAFLRAFEHTLAYQPVTPAEWDGVCAHGFYVEEDDAVISDDFSELLVPATKYWFASGMSHMGPSRNGIGLWIHYNPTGLALRECLMAGATAMVR
jgi:hypothetical protein